MINYESLFKVSYGLYIVCSGDKNKANGFISNTIFQVSSEPALFAACCNKNNYTAEFIQRQGAFSVSVLDQDSSADIIGTFGYKSGREVDKMKGMDIKYGETGVPIILNECIAYMECKCIQTIDVGTHLIFIGNLISAEMLDESKEPLTYAHYRKVRKGVSPKNAPSFIDPSKLAAKINKPALKKYECLKCGYIYEDTEEERFEDLPDNWKCPICGSGKSEFDEIR